MDIFDVINNRRSVREYKKEQIKDEELNKILNAAIMAPTARGEQPWHFTIIQDKKVLDEIDQVSRDFMKGSGNEFYEMIGNSNRNITHNAPTLVMVSGKIGGSNIEADCGAATQNMLLAAEGLDIGSCWLGLVAWYFEDEENLSKLGIPKDFKPLYGVSLGYKVKPNSPAPKRNKEVFNWIK
ncbi:MAG: nitroreductase family protein [Methanobrevibacter sp.]|jgi:nitroreductase|nr:nitroreductase family protein [Candidatus Methanoflexus mossambicus]